ncbi:MAG TPA: hypothetical protein VIK66_04620 [Gaiellaceae bacterium]|jgi:hypothetical protein
MRQKVLLAACVAALAAVFAGTASAGEVKGPPGTPGVGRTLEEVQAIRTGAPANSQSICSYNGLNDMVIGQGPIDNIVQTPHTQGSPGEAGADPAGSGTPGSPTCGRGSNFENP